MSATAVTGAATGFENGEYVHAAEAVARRFGDIADQLDDSASIVASGWDEAGARARLRGVAAWWLRQSLVIDTDPLRSVASALREASAVMAELAARFRSAELIRWQAVAVATASGPASAGTSSVLAGSPAAGRLDAPAVAAETHAAASAAERLCELARRSRAARRERHDRGVELVNEVRGWGSDVTQGVAESVGSLFGAGLDALGLVNRVSQDPIGGSNELKAVGGALLEVVTDPRRLLDAVLDLDTWQSNPARAIGHLVPDLVLAATGGGAAIGAIRARSAGRVLLERGLKEEAAIMARRALLDRSASGRAPGILHLARQGWAGERGLRLSAEQCQIIARYLHESAAAEAALRRRMAELARSVQGRLTVLDDVAAGLEDHSVKALDSLLRKVATKLRQDGIPDAAGQQLLRILYAQPDTVRYTIVLSERSYLASARQLARVLDRAAVAPDSWKNSWVDRTTAYRGINTSWTDVATGVRFEVQLHTQASRAASLRTHRDYEEARLPETPEDRKQQLAGVIAREYARATLPPGVEDLQLPRVMPSPLRGAAAAPPELGAVLVGGGLLISLRSLPGAVGGRPEQSIDPDFRDLRAQVTGPGGR